MIGNLIGAKPLLYCLHHQVANQARINPLGRRNPTHHLSIAAIQGKRYPDSFSVIARQF
jgi:hypothetical protein